VNKQPVYSAPVKPRASGLVAGEGSPTGAVELLWDRRGSHSTSDLRLRDFESRSAPATEDPSHRRMERLVLNLLILKNQIACWILEGSVSHGQTQ
jgi:hypothetical protein